MQKKSDTPFEWAIHEDSSISCSALSMKLRRLTAGGCWLELWCTGELILALLFGPGRSDLAKAAADFLIDHWGIPNMIELPTQNFPPKREKWSNPDSYFREDAFYASEKFRVFIEEDPGGRSQVSLKIPAGQVLSLSYSGADRQARSSEDAARLTQLMRLPKPEFYPIHQEVS